MISKDVSAKRMSPDYEGGKGEHKQDNGRNSRKGEKKEGRSEESGTNQKEIKSRIRVKAINDRSKEIRSCRR